MSLNLSLHKTVAIDDGKGFDSMPWTSDLFSPDFVLFTQVNCSEGQSIGMAQEQKAEREMVTPLGGCPRRGYFT